MAWIHYEQVSLAPTTSGSYSANTQNTYNGFLHALRYVASTGATVLPSTDGNLTVQGEKTGIQMLNLSDLSTAGTGTYYVRQATVNTSGATSTGLAQFPLVNERLTITISSGSTGGTRTGTLSVFIS